MRIEKEITRREEEDEASSDENDKRTDEEDKHAEKDSVSTSSADIGGEATGEVEETDVIVAEDDAPVDVDMFIGMFRIAMDMVAEEHAIAIPEM
jgi:hypothetical protein